jgi:DNA polymerase V
MIYAVAEHLEPMSLPYFDVPRPSAGFPSPAADFVEGQLDLNTHLIKQPSATFLVRIAGDSLSRAGILDGDLAVVDRSVQPRAGMIVVVVLYGELLIKRLQYSGEQVWLHSDNADPRFEPFLVPSDAAFEIWGAVTSTIRDRMP